MSHMGFFWCKKQLLTVCHLDPKTAIPVRRASLPVVLPRVQVDQTTVLPPVTPANLWKDQTLKISLIHLIFDAASQHSVSSFRHSCVPRRFQPLLQWDSKHLGHNSYFSIFSHSKFMSEYFCPPFEVQPLRVGEKQRPENAASQKIWFNGNRSR